MQSAKAMIMASEGSTRMQSGISELGHPRYQDIANLIASLKACAKAKDLYQGTQLHAHILANGLLEQNKYVGSTLVSMYGKCGAIEKAQDVFDKLDIPDVVSWTSLISGYAHNGLHEKAMTLFEQMQRLGLSPNAKTFTCILKACGGTQLVLKGKEIHAEICRQGLLKNNVIVGSALVDMYAKCGVMLHAESVVKEFRDLDVFSWTALIAGYIQYDYDNRALNAFERMPQEGVFPNGVTFSSILKACSSTEKNGKVHQIHVVFNLDSLLYDNVLLVNALVDAYAKCGEFAKAESVLKDSAVVSNVITWTSLMAGYVQRGCAPEAMNCLKQMHSKGVFPDSSTFVCLLKACGIMRSIQKGKEAHADILKDSWHERNIIVGTALVDMYAKCGSFSEARKVFHDLPDQDLFSWTVLITGYVEHGHIEEAHYRFQRMLCGCLFPNTATFVSTLRTCGTAGLANKGKELHVQILAEGLLEENDKICSALVDMYAKSGALTNAQQVFDKLRYRTVVSWTALLCGYAQLGMDEIVYDSFEKMVGEGIKPNFVTFTVLLKACSHSGLLQKGQMYFEIMSIMYGVMPTFQHHTCMIDLYTRAGHFNEAVAIIRKLPTVDSPSVWTTLLGACQKWGEMKFGRWAFKHAVQFNEKDPAAYISMSNIYSFPIQDSKCIC